MSDRLRIYLPLDGGDLDALDRDRALPAATRTGFAVTDRLRATAPGEDVEGLEYLAGQDAATDAAARDLRVVAAVDIEERQLHDLAGSESASAVEISGELPLRHVASFHLLDAPGDRDVDADFELSWYDVTELSLVRRSL